MRGVESGEGPSPGCSNNDRRIEKGGFFPAAGVLRGWLRVAFVGVDGPSSSNSKGGGVEMGLVGS